MDNKKIRIFMCVFGVIMCSIAVGFFKLAAFGIDPFQAFMNGLNKVIPISFGILYIVVNLLLLTFSFVADKSYIGIATFVNMFLVGYIVDFSYSVLLGIFPGIGMLGRIIAFIIAIFIICLGSSFYYVASLGVSTYDAIPLIIANTWKKGKFKYIRITSDCICVAIGSGLFLFAGGTMTELFAIVGIGTIIIAFCMGPLIDFFVKKLAEPFLLYYNEKSKNL